MASIMADIEKWLERHHISFQTILAIVAIGGIIWGAIVFVPTKFKEWRYPSHIYLKLFGFYGDKQPWEVALYHNRNIVELPFELKKDEAFTVNLKLIQKNSIVPYFNYIHIYFPEDVVKIKAIPDKDGWVWLEANDIRENVYFLDCTVHTLVNNAHNILSFNITPLTDDVVNKGIACSYRITYQVAGKRNSIYRMFNLQPRGASERMTFRQWHNNGNTLPPVSEDQGLSPATPTSVKGGGIN